MNDATNAVRYDKATDRLETSAMRIWLGVQLMRLVERGTRPLDHTGISRLHALVGKVFPPSSVTEIRLESGATFAFPSGDYYWNRLLTKGWDYEPDVQSVMKALAGVPYVFVDIGANFGFFSCLAASPVFGSQRVIAVEPAQKAFDFLVRNLSSEADRVTLRKLAIDQTSNNVVTLHGDRHAGLSLLAGRRGLSPTGSEAVTTTSIDDLLAHEGLDARSQPVLVKLEVEGIEMRALRGASRTLEGDSAFILEEIEESGVSEAARFVLVTLGMSVFRADGDRFVPVSDIAALEAHRRTKQGLQHRGTSLLVFRNPVWLERLASILPV